MTFAEFGNFDNRGKMDSVYKDGVYIGKRYLDGKKAILFQLGSFYVEIVYEHYREVVHQISATETPEVLQFYLEQVPLPEIKGIEKEE